MPKVQSNSGFSYLVSQEYYDRYSKNNDYPISSMIHVLEERMDKVEEFCRDFNIPEIRDGLYKKSWEQILQIEKCNLEIDFAFQNPDSPLHDAWQLVHIDRINLNSKT